MNCYKIPVTWKMYGIRTIYTDSPEKAYSQMKRMEKADSDAGDFFFIIDNHKIYPLPKYISQYFIGLESIGEIKNSTEPLYSVEEFKEKMNHHVEKITEDLDINMYHI